MFVFVGLLREARTCRYQFCSPPWHVININDELCDHTTIDSRRYKRLSTGHVLRGNLAGLPPGWINALRVNTRLLRALICKRKNYFLPLSSSLLKQVNARFRWSYVPTKKIHNKRNRRNKKKKKFLEWKK